MIKQKLTDRMKLRITAISALKNAILPGFCEDMVCDDTCPLYLNLFYEPCQWQRTYNSINRMEHITLKEKQEIE